MEPLLVASFEVTGEPVSKARARFSKTGHAYTPAATVAGEQKIAWSFKSAAKYRPTGDDEYRVEAEFYCGGQRRDVDNMLKAILDALNGLAWADDNQVTEIYGKKLRRSPERKTVVRIYRLGEMQNPTETCRECAKVFRIFPSLHSKFCSQECHTEWLRKKRMRTCEQCGSEWDPKNNRPTARFCSRECAAEAGRVAVTCEVCQTSFSKQKSWVERNAHHFCSPECRQEYWRPRRASRAAGICVDCGNPTTKKVHQRCAVCAAGGVSGRPRVIIGEPCSTTSPPPTTPSDLLLSESLLHPLQASESLPSDSAAFGA
jgi:Holliday junction resolvase RusA-like endonuclease